MHSRTYVTVRYAETDRMGIAHHANFPIWFEIGRTDFIRLFDTTYTEMEESVQSFGALHSAGAV